MKHLIHVGIALLGAFLGTATASAQASPLPSADVQRIYDRLLKHIDQIPIYDNHSHATFPDDSDMDAMASPPEESTVMRLRDTNPEFVAAAKALFGYPYDDFKPEHAKWLVGKKKAAEAAGGTAYWDSILDKMNIEICLANRVALAAYLDPKRFHWVFFVDSFLFAFDNHSLIAKNGDMAVYIPPREKAEAIYAQFRAGGVPSEEDYRTFQDYIFRVLIDQAGKLKLPVHFHSAVGIGDYFSLRNGNPLNLENVLRDPRYSNVKFVLIHGGYPYTLDMIWLTAAKNVYTDSSLMGYYVYPSELKNILKQWISLYPERMMFGSDAFPFNDAVGAEETFWLAVLVAEGALTEEKAIELARLYLHDNAAKLYGDMK